MKTHSLKCWPEFFEAMLKGEKTFDIRLNDRDFQVGDTVKMREYDPDTKEYTGRGMDFNIVYITDGIFGQLGTNQIVMQLEPAMVLGFNFPRDKTHTIEDLVDMMKESKIKSCKATINVNDVNLNMEISRVLEQT